MSCSPGWYDRQNTSKCRPCDEDQISNANFTACIPGPMSSHLSIIGVSAGACVVVIGVRGIVAYLRMRKRLQAARRKGKTTPIGGFGPRVEGNDLTRGLLAPNDVGRGVDPSSSDDIAPVDLRAYPGAAAPHVASSSEKAGCLRDLLHQRPRGMHPFLLGRLLPWQLRSKATQEPPLTL